MERRSFLKNTAISAVAVSAYGFVSFNGDQFVGDCETTTDILGPYYRPDSPVRNNFIMKGDPGTPIELSGLIRHTDCITPYSKAKIELWHCDAKGIYDNASSELRYRGTTYSDEKGYYSFNTILPVPYDVGNGHTRPAHFHLMITADGYMPLVTQLYFNGDVHISKDPYASSPKSKRRILDVQKSGNGLNKVVYDVSMAEVLKLEAASIDKLTGVYTDTVRKDKSVELFKRDNTLWMKNEAFGNKFEYAGNNIFEEADNPEPFYWKLRFEVLSSEAIRLTESYIDDDKTKHTSVYLKQ
jgi:protocatechuate 3,4-dioxygenase beta subunit